ncbi:MAG: cyclic nucleotide-binding domain-containing protein [Chloroflexi bacterium]|nr:cyclic nucleotide-binding domain-containing protein [Chloroflexota bacterium]
MSARVIDNLRKVEIFAGLRDDELVMVAGLCKALRVPARHTIFKEGDAGEELYVVHEGSVRVMITTRTPDGTSSPSTINTLYPGQCFGEQALLGGAARTATVVASEPTTLIVMRAPEFDALAERNPHIGFIVIRNLARDLAYKLNASNLLLRGNIRWRGDELGKR